MKRTLFYVPAPIIAYNCLMNRVDRMDQLRSSNPTQQREQRLQMSIWTLCLDVSVNNTYAIYKKLHQKKKKRTMSLWEFKHKICCCLVLPVLEKRRKNATSEVIPVVALGHRLPSANDKLRHHVLVTNKKNKKGCMT